MDYNLQTIEGGDWIFLRLETYKIVKSKNYVQQYALKEFLPYRISVASI